MGSLAFGQVYSTQTHAQEAWAEMTCPDCALSVMNSCRDSGYGSNGVASLASDACSQDAALGKRNWDSFVLSMDSMIPCYIHST